MSGLGACPSERDAIEPERGAKALRPAAAPLAAEACFALRNGLGDTYIGKRARHVFFSMRYYADSFFGGTT